MLCPRKELVPCPCRLGTPTEVPSLCEIQRLQILVVSACLIEQPGNHMGRVEFIRWSLLADVQNVLVDFWGRDEGYGLRCSQLTHPHRSCYALARILFHRKRTFK